MKPRNRAKRDLTLPKRLFVEAQRLIREAAKAPSEAYRNLLIRRVIELEEASRVEGWLSSPELRRPT